jgi:hypothetical protein
MRPAFLLLWCLPILANVASARDVPSTAQTATAMTDAAQKFLKTLDAAATQKATMAFDDPKRMDWHNIPKPERKGLQFKEMTEAQRVACLALLKASLSDVGYEKSQKIMSLEANLKEGEKNLKNGQLRDPERYFLTIFGTPGDKGDWGYSFEGHHFSLNFVISNNRIIASTPSFWGANPATVQIFVEGGPAKGTRTLAAEEQLAFDLVNSLDDAQKKKAIIADKPPKEYRNAGDPKPPHAADKELGISGSELTDAQKKTLWSLLESYNANLSKEVAESRLAQIKAAGLERVGFAWLGSTKPGVGHSYRIEGPTFVLELINVQSDPAGNPANHIHSVWRDARGDFGTSKTE